MPHLFSRLGAASARRPAACLLAAAVALCSGCLGFAHHARRAPLPAWAVARGLRRVEVQAGRYIGLSDLSALVDDAGRRQLYLVPERQRAILALQAPGPAPRSRASAGNGNAPSQAIEVLAARPVARSLEGVPPYLDTESLAALGNGRFALGTEAPWPSRSHDDVLLVTLGDNGGRVTESLRFDYAPYGLRGASNAGLEALCSDGRDLFAASETCGDLPDGGRFAPLGRRRPDEPNFVPYRLQLTSDTGRIAALACRPQPGAEAQATEVVAIERHYGVARLLYFVLPRTLSSDALVPAKLALDLAPLVQPLVNYEGVAWLEDGDLLLVADNSIGFATGPTEGLVVPWGLLHTSGP